MTMQRVKCREHDGWFRRVVKPGRPPVRCSQETPCDKVMEGVTRGNRRPNHVVTRENTASAAEKRASVVSQLAKHTGLREDQIVIGKPDAKPTRRQLEATREEFERQDRMDRENAKRPVVAAEPRSPRNRSVPLAQSCKAELEALGWTAKGRGWFEEPDDHGEFPGAEMAEVTAVRGSESLVITWNDGKVSRQDYNLWHGRRSLNGAPARKLKFNPDEMTDREFVRAISGMKVTWWNTLGKTEESYVVGDKVSIEHFYASNGDEDNGRRIVKFIDMNGNGYRHFHVEALLKVG